MRAVLLALVACVSGCASQARTTEELRGALSPGSVVLSVPTVRPDATGECGLACLTALIRHHGLDLDDEARARFPREAAARESIAAGDIRDYLRGRGFRAYLVRGQLDHVPPRGMLALLDGSLPLIVALRMGGQLHYVLVCGYDPGRRWVVVMDPSRGVGIMPYARFDASWKETDRLMLVAARSPVPPANGP